MENFLHTVSYLERSDDESDSYIIPFYLYIVDTAYGIDTKLQKANP